MAAPVCDACLHRTAADVAALPADYADLSQELVRYPTRSEDKIARSVPASSPPIDVGVEILRDAIWWTTGIWAARVRSVERLNKPRIGAVRRGFAVSTNARLLTAHIRVLADLPAAPGRYMGVDRPSVSAGGVDAIRALQGLHRRARRVLALAKVVIRLPGDCSNCGAWMLRRNSGGTTVWCGACDTRWSYEDYHRYVGLMLVNPAIVSTVDQPES